MARIIPIIHMLASDGRGTYVAQTTMCGAQGYPVGAGRYKPALGPTFRAVTAGDAFQGPTCVKCKVKINAMKKKHG